MKQKLILVAFALMLVLSCMACSVNDEQVKANEEHETGSNTLDNETQEALISSVPIVDENNVRYISNTLDRIASYGTFESLEKSASSIISGVCVSTKSVYQNDILFTLSEIMVESSYRGGFKAGDTVLVVEIGGRTTFGEFEKNCNIEEKAFEQGAERLPDDYKLVMGNDGYFPIQEKEQVLLMLVDESGFLKDVTEPLYSVLGSYDGKFFLQEDGSYAKPLPGQTDKLEFGEESLRITIDELEAIQD